MKVRKFGKFADLGDTEITIGQNCTVRHSVGFVPDDFYSIF